MGPVFLNRDSGALIEILNVDEPWTQYRVLGALGGTMSIATAFYDSGFTTLWRPATPDDLAGRTEVVRLPANADQDPDWADLVAQRRSASGITETP